MENLIKPTNNMIIPTVIEKTSNGERAYDIYSRLLEDRIVHLNEQVDHHSMDLIIAQLEFLDHADSERPIQLYINSPGGSVVDGLALVDTINQLKAPVYTICRGMAASMGAVILSAGAKGHRYITDNSEVLVHPMSGGTTGRTNDSIIAMRHESKMQDNLLALLGHNCGRISDKSYAEIKAAVRKMRDIDPESKLDISAKALKELNAFKKECEYDHWMFGDEALEFGIVDQILKENV